MSYKIALYYSELKAAFDARMGYGADENGAGPTVILLHKDEKLVLSNGTATVQLGDDEQEPEKAPEQLIKSAYQDAVMVYEGPGKGPECGFTRLVLATGNVTDLGRKFAMAHGILPYASALRFRAVKPESEIPAAAAVLTQNPFATVPQRIPRRS
jgi:hypothetical protein